MVCSRRSFLRSASLPVAGLWQPRTFAGPGSAGLERSTPETEGVASSAIEEFLAAAAEEHFELHSFMMVRHGRVIAEAWWEPYGPDDLHAMYSVSKSFTAMAAGFAVADGLLNLDDHVISFFPDDLPRDVSANLEAMRVRDLLTMTTGHERPVTQVCILEENWVRTFLAQSIDYPPGTRFLYNTAAAYMCSAIVQKVTGRTVLDNLTRRLFGPLGIQGVQWETCPRGINTGGWGLSIQTEGLAKFGQFLLQKGCWNGRQLLPAAWIEEATRAQIQQSGYEEAEQGKENSDYAQGYGYQIWRCQHGGFRAEGAFGQFCIGLPELDAVVVMTGENKELQSQLDLVWTHLLPACGIESRPPADLSWLHHVKLAPTEGATTARAAIDRHYRLEANDLGLETVSFAFRNGFCVFTAGANAIPCGLGTWRRSEAYFPGAPPRLIPGGKPRGAQSAKFAASAAWSDDATLVMTWRYYETPHSDTVTCQFEGDRLTITFLSSIIALNRRGLDPRAPLRGRMST